MRRFLISLIFSHFLILPHAHTFTLDAPEISDTHVYHVTCTTAEFGTTISTHGQLTTAWFEYGIDTGYGSVTERQSSSIPEWVIRTAPQPLLKSTLYHYRAVAENEDGRVFGPDQLFMTSPPSVVTLPPDSITTHTAVLSAACNPFGELTAVYFLAGVDSTYSIASTEPVIIAADTELHLCSIRITQLSADSKYFVWAVARNVLFPDVMSQGIYQVLRTMYDSDAAGIIIPLTITNARGNSCRLSFGVHTSATSHIDPALGEYELPPCPPGAESFWSRFSGIGLGLGCDRDYRTFASEVQRDTFQIALNAGTDGFPLTISWGQMQSLFDSALLTQNNGPGVNMVSESQTEMSDSTMSHFRIITFGPHPVRHLPNIITNLPAEVTPSSAEVSDSFIPNGDETFVWYQWGPTREYGKSTLPQVVGDSVKALTLHRTLTGLLPGTVYHFRSVAENDAGRSFGMDDTFATPPVTGVKYVNGFPVGFILRQNYPNPFNRGTIIEYSLAARENVDLKIYDVLGREILIPAHGTRDAGTYRVPVDLGGCPSGMYFYELRAGNFSLARGMLYGK